MRIVRYGVGLLILAALATAGGAQAPPPGRHWVGTWAASPQAAPAVRGVALDNQTVRMIVRVSVGGDSLRLRFSNAFGTQPVTLGDVHVALAGDGSAIVPGSDHAVTFSGRPAGVMPPGADLVSDPVALAVPALARLAVSVYVPGPSGPVTWHDLADQTNYIAGLGDLDARPDLPSAQTTTHWYWLSGVETLAAPRSFAIVTLGDSITDGYQSTQDANHRWPDILADRVSAPASAGGPAVPLAVLNEGISGNRILHDQAGPNALARFDRDVLAQDGVRDLVIMEGINDIGWPDEPNGRYAAQNVTAADIIAGLRQMIERAHAHGIRVYGATLTPFLGAGYETPAGEAKREAINAWIREPGHFDGVIDFARVTSDPDHPGHFLPAYDSGDHLHPDDAGYRAMGLAAAQVLDPDAGR